MYAQVARKLNHVCVRTGAVPADEGLEGIKEKIKEIRSSVQDDLQSLNSSRQQIEQQEAALAGAKDIEELILFMQKSGLSNQQIEAAMAAHEEGNQSAVKAILGGMCLESHCTNVT